MRDTRRYKQKVAPFGPAPILWEYSLRSQERHPLKVEIRNRLFVTPTKSFSTTDYRATVRKFGTANTHRNG